MLSARAYSPSPIECVVALTPAPVNVTVQTVPPLLEARLTFGATVVPLALAEAPVTIHGLAPLPDDQKVPHRMLPPGSFDPDEGPSDVIFPAQHITLRFNHQKHLAKGMQLTCKTCHGKAYGSASSQDVLLPKGSSCDACRLAGDIRPAHDPQPAAIRCH